MVFSDQLKVIGKIHIIISYKHFALFHLLNIIIQIRKDSIPYFKALPMAMGVAGLKHHIPS
jgi:hypothetical protein